MDKPLFYGQPARLCDAGMSEQRLEQKAASSVVVPSFTTVRDAGRYVKAGEVGLAELPGYRESQ